MNFPKKKFFKGVVAGETWFLSAALTATVVAENKLRSIAGEDTSRNFVLVWYFTVLAGVTKRERD